jgi:hypothetical protein
VKVESFDPGVPSFRNIPCDQGQAVGIRHPIMLANQNDGVGFAFKQIGAFPDIVPNEIVDVRVGPIGMRQSGCPLFHLRPSLENGPQRF